ncbi:MAG: C39 family peptidase, partial [Halanaerobacter sp.]
WQGEPDEITKKFGKMKAQYAGGFTEVFNYYAHNNDLDVRIRNNVNVSPQYIEDQLEDGKPVIAHGKFTSYGHIIVLVGFDDQYYYAHDPSGKWNQKYRGGYGKRTPQNGKYVRYKKDNLLRAMERSIGLWIHEIYFKDNKLTSEE